MIFSILILVFSAFLVLAACHKGRSVGLPVAFIAALLLVHLPGGLAHMSTQNTSSFAYKMTALGVEIASIGALFFALGVRLARRQSRSQSVAGTETNRHFLLFCLGVGWLLILIFPLVSTIPSVSAVIAKAAPVWIIGAALGLKAALADRKLFQIAGWAVAILAFPAFTLISIGFIATATVATLIALAPSLLLIRRLWLAFLALSVTAAITLSLFVGYFANRDEIRASVWGGASLEQRLESVSETVKTLAPVDLENPEHLLAIEQRLNQNYFVGIAADRLEAGSVDYLYGMSIVDGFLALVPRAVWPNKPVVSGSGDLVREATGLGSQLSDTTSWGVGIVLELYYNFGWLGIAFGMLLFGYSLSRLDRYVFAAAAAGDQRRLLPAYLVAIALIFPEGSFVDIIGGAGAALLVGLGLATIYHTIAPGTKRRSRYRLRGV